MSLYVDKMFANLVGTRLEQFKRKSDDLWNFRDPICGDSKKNKLKTRGYFYRRGDSLFFSCHNCGATMSFQKFLKTAAPDLYGDYLLESFGEEKKDKEDIKQNFTPVFMKKIDLPTIESLPYNHVAKRYLIDRKIPKERFSELYWAHDFKSFTESISPNTDCTKMLSESRIIIPFYSENKELLGFQGRDLSPNSKVKYITVKLSDSNLKIFGLDKLDKSKKIYVVEGPLDSMFLDNSIATMDPTLYKAATILGQLDFVFIFDNQPRNKDIVRLMRKTIDYGYNICIWPKAVHEKDINDMVVSGMTAAQVQNIIDNNIYCDLEAQLQFDDWRKV